MVTIPDPLTAEDALVALGRDLIDEIRRGNDLLELSAEGEGIYGEEYDQPARRRGRCCRACAPSRAAITRE